MALTNDYMILFIVSRVPEFQLRIQVRTGRDFSCRHVKKKKVFNINQFPKETSKLDFYQEVKINNKLYSWPGDSF